MFAYSNRFVQGDLKEITGSPIVNWKAFNHTTILITGINGMLATYIMFTLIYLIEKLHYDIKIIALTRTKEKSETIYGAFLHKEYIDVLTQDIKQPIVYIESIDYIFHLAGNASPYFINNQPVDIISTNLLGTLNILELAREKESKKVILASTREVYGAMNLEKLTEEDFGSLNPLDNRSCYPESKRAAESLSRSYYLQYGVKTVIARIAHSYGPGMKIKNDGRVMADFIGNAVRNENIVLNSSGEAIRSFLYLSDAIIALFKLALEGKAGEAYNLSNETEPLPIYQIAQIICKLFPEKNIQVVFAKDRPQTGYCNYPRVALDNSKIENLGWYPTVRLIDGLQRTILSYE